MNASMVDDWGVYLLEYRNNMVVSMIPFCESNGYILLAVTGRICPLISWQGFYHFQLQAMLEDQDVCYGTDVPLVVTPVPEAISIRCNAPFLFDRFVTSVLVA
jgi:hypothetical protein